MRLLDPKRRRAAALAARSGFVVAAVAFVTSVVGATATSVPPAAAATAGIAQVIEPFEVGVPGSGGLLDEGDSLTEFSLSLPRDAKCSGDSATQGYRVESYMVPVDVDPGSLTFGNDGPEPSSSGVPYSAFRQPLHDAQRNPFLHTFTAEASPPGGPGLVINVNNTALSFAAYDPLDTGETYLPPGDYSIGVACWGPQDDPKVDNFWDAEITIVADSSDTGPVGIRWTAAPAPEETTVALVADPNAEAVEGEDVTLTATVEPSEAEGTITFKDGSDAIGSAVELTDGKAEHETDELELGDHTLTAVFTPAEDSNFAASSSPEIEYTISEGDGTTTTTTGGTTTTTAGSTTTTAVGVAGTSTPSGPSTGVGLSGLARTGGSLTPTIWGILLVVFGRMAILLGRPPRVLSAGAT